ncbi:hypothetical protein SNEBB_008047 [Seison nebaliae]|nr:hypothetical protein SNEBB_008047 [Seison nebaliae]
MYPYILNPEYNMFAHPWLNMAQENPTPSSGISGPLGALTGGFLGMKVLSFMNDGAEVVADDSIFEIVGDIVGAIF